MIETKKENESIAKKDIKVMIVDDDEDVRENTSDLLSTLFEVVEAFSSPEKLLNTIRQDSACVILTDLRMPNADGFEFAKQVKSIAPDLPVILMTGYGDISIAVDAMKHGVYDFIEKPFNTDHLIETIKRAVDKRYLSLSLKLTKERLDNINTIEGRIIGQSPTMKELKQKILKLAPMDVPVMIFGETGAGKELVARSLHEFSFRFEKPFVALNCAAIPENLAEAELFGYEKGAFTDAHQARRGKLEYAHGGTLFLDEVESLSLMTQAKLLRALSDQRISPLGSNREVRIDCRIISATKDELRNNPDFRQDLFFRLQVAEIKIPALRERDEDIITLFEFFVAKHCENFGTQYKAANYSVRNVLLSYDWPGNVREVINVATRYAINGCTNIHDAVAGIDMMPIEEESNDSLKEQLSAFEEKLLRTKLSQYHGRVGPILEDLKLERRTFNQKLVKYGITTDEYRH